MTKANSRVSLLSLLRDYLARPLTHPTVIPMVVIFVFAAILIPQMPRSDWLLNTKDLSDNLNIYDNPDFVYPPWSLVYLWVYRGMTAAGARIASVLVIAWLVISRRWSLKTFLVLMVNLFFLFTLMFSNMDILVLILPILLWETVEDWEYDWIGRGVAMSIMVIKPQGAILILPYLAWRARKRWRRLIPAGILTALVTIPISFVGKPILLLQWLDNIQNPSPQNTGFWAVNNMSLSGRVGIIQALLIVIIVFGLFYWLRRWLNKSWTHNHNLVTLMVVSFLLSPYASLQSLIGGFAFAPSALTTVLQYVITFGTSHFDIYITFLPAWIILMTFLSLWFIPPEGEASVE